MANWEHVAFVRGSHRIWERFTSGWQELPRAVRRRWLTTLAAGLAVCLVLSALATVIGRHLVASGALDWERRWLLDFERADRLTFHSALWLEGLGSSAMVVPLVVTATVLAMAAGRPLRALLVVASYLPAKLLIFTGWTLWDRSRPDFIADGLAVPGSLHSFPSGHIVQTITAWGLLVWFWHRASQSGVERAIAWLLFALLVAAVALARLRLGTHWPSDMVAGIAIGLVWLAVLAYADARGGLSRDGRDARGPSGPAGHPPSR